MTSRTTARFRAAFAALPQDVRRRARAAFALWQGDPAHPSLRFKQVGVCARSRPRALRMALAMRAAFDEMAAGWRRRGHELGFGVGVSLGYATVGLVGHEGRYDYTANGSVVVLAARLCAEARAGQVLVTQRVLGAIGEEVEAEPIGELELKGLPRPVAAFDVLAWRPAEVKA